MTAAKLKRLKALYANRDDDFWKWRDFVEAIGIEATLEGLGFPLDRNVAAGESRATPLYGTFEVKC